MCSYPVLYSFRRCPYAIRARMVLKRAGIRCELREVRLKDKPAEMLRISEKGTVPVLQLQDGKILDESLAIMLWALEQHDPDSWLAVDEGRAQELISRNDLDFKVKLDRYKYHARHPEHSQEYYREQAKEFLSELEDLLAATAGRGLLQGRTSLADIALFPFIRQFARVDWGWFCQGHYKFLKRWLAALEESELFLSIMHKHPPWRQDDLVTLF